MKKKSLILVACCCLLIFVLAACEETASKEPSPPLSTEEVAQMYTDPTSFKGRTVELTGIVFGNTEYDNDGIYFQMFNDITNSKNNTVVFYSNSDLKLEEGNYVKLTGTVTDVYNGKNAFGAKISAPAITADTVNVISYIDAVSPTLKEVKLENPAQEQSGYKITVDKVEFAASETRVYLTIENNGTAKFNVYSFDAKIIQAGNQFAEQTNYDAEYPEIQTDLLPGAATTGIIAFPSLQQTDFKLVLDASSDDYDQTINPYTFDIVVK